MKSSYFKSLLLVSTMVALSLTACGDKKETSTVSEGSTESVVASSIDDNSSAMSGEGIEFPYIADEGKLKINSVFPSDIENPDSLNEFGEGIASIEFVNQSDEYLRSATFFVTMTDGTLKTFTATDIPAGETDWVFEKDCQTVETEQTVEDISYDTVYADNDNSVMDLLSVNVNNLEVTVTNNSDQELLNLHVLCHADMGESLYGGITYTYNIDYLGSGETAVVDAGNCLLGVKVIDVVKE